MRTRLLYLLAAGTFALSAAPASAAPKPGSVSAKQGGVSATLTYVRTGGGGAMKEYRSLLLTVRASGRTTLRRLPIGGAAKRAQSARPRLRVVELTGDGVADVIVDVFTGGAHCCSVSAIVPSTTKSWGPAIVKNWADHSYALKDLGGASTPEFVTDDARFTAAYSSYAASASPIRIYSMEGGKLRVVTRQFPAAIREDEQAWAGEFARVVSEDVDQASFREFARATTAARVADLVMVGDYAGAKGLIEISAERGDFVDLPGFRGQLGHDLIRWNYLTDPTLVGLTNDPTN